ncbi:MAG: rhomboid family intramembrane serine protease [Pirellulales bacterium]
MGLYDRDYFKDDQPSGVSLATQPMVVKIVLANVALYVVNMFTSDWLFDAMALRLDVFTRPWNIWQLLSYGFAHDPNDLMHIVVNMFMLWMFGRIVEQVYGGREFLRFYLLSIIVGGTAWAITDKLAGAPPNTALIGASAGVAGVIILFTLRFPQQEVRLMFLFPIKAWVFGVLFVAGDAFGFFGHQSAGPGPQVAYMAHLGGAATALAYAKLGWNLGLVPPFSWIGGGVSLPKFGRQPKLRIHDPDEADEPRAMGEEVDRILQKITEQGESSLTNEERRTLTEASRRYQRRRS